MGIINKEDPEYITKCSEYMNYINEHIDNVNKAFIKLFRNPEKEVKIDGYNDQELSEILDILEKEVENHDASKFTDKEFEPYRKRFSPTKKEIEAYREDIDLEQFMVEDYNDAWFHHYTRNPHHPKFWKNTFIKESGKYGNPLKWSVLTVPADMSIEMDIVSILHMICDWEAMSMKFGGSTIEWYNTKSKEEREDMSPVTRMKLKNILESIYNNKVLDEIKEQ